MIQVQTMKKSKVYVEPITYSPAGINLITNVTHIRQYIAV